jgi:arabinogalactan oligomer/maltooligosaccharide transport system substrate-binding protein
MITPGMNMPGKARVSFKLFLIIGVLLLAACRGTPTVRSDETAVPATTDQSGITQAATSTAGLYPVPDMTDTPKPSQSPAAILKTTEAGETGYPEPESSLTPVTPATLVPTLAVAPAITLTPTVALTPTMTLTPTATEFVGSPVQLPPSSVSTVTIWHSWDEEQTQALERVIKSFQVMYPDISFDVLYIPADELRDRYEEASYFGGGPSLLLGQAEWGPAFFDSGLVIDLTPYAGAEFLSTINPAALGTGQYHGALISLPQAVQGVVLFRNQSLIPQAPATFDELVAEAQDTSQRNLGVVGAYLDRGVYYSSAALYGIGGQVMDENGIPKFNDPFGLQWLKLLEEFEQAGPVGNNTNRDIELFEEGQVGMIIEDSWNWPALAESIGSENLVIDPWPSYGQGKLSGYVQAESVYLNTNVSEENQVAALQFMGYLLDPNVQSLLSEVGFIPAVTNTQTRNAHVHQAALALSSGTTYPVTPDDRYYTVYWSALESAISQVFEQGVEPSLALQTAYDFVVTRLSELQGTK